MELISIYELGALFLCFFASGFFSGSEAALLSIGIDRANQLIEIGGPKGRALSFLIERPNEMLTTILVGNNVVNIWAASLTTTIASRYFASDAVGISVGVTTFFILIFGEIIPKTFARRHAESLAVFIIRVLQLVYYILYPIIKGTVSLIEMILGGNAELGGRLVTKNDLEFMVSKAEKERSMDSKQLDMLSSILEFPTIKVKDIMIPRSQVKYIQKSYSFDEAVSVVRTDIHSRYPVCDGTLDQVVGFLHVKDLAFVSEDEKKDFKIENLLKSPFFVYEHMKIQAVFDHMNRKKVHLALVKDENGLVVGIITLEDIVEEILGEIQDEHDRDEQHVKKEYEQLDSEMGITVNPSLSLRDLDQEYNIRIPLNDNYSTVAGFILDMLGNNFPKKGQIIVWEGLTFELIEVESQEIKKIRIRTVEGEHLYSKSGNGVDREKSPSSYEYDNQKLHAK